MSALSLVEECGAREETRFSDDGGKRDGGSQKDQTRKRNERRSVYSLRERSTPLTSISEGEEDREWKIGDVFSGLDKDSPKKK